jgi:hypothetical protein
MAVGLYLNGACQFLLGGVGLHEFDSRGRGRRRIVVMLLSNDGPSGGVH